MAPRPRHSSTSPETSGTSGTDVCIRLSEMYQRCIRDVRGPSGIYGICEKV